MTPIHSIPEASTSVLTFTQLNIILRFYEQLSNPRILSVIPSPVASPNDGDAYIVAETGTTGIFNGRSGDIAFSIGGAYYFIEVPDTLTGFTVYNSTTGYLHIRRVGGYNVVIDPSSVLEADYTVNSSINLAAVNVISVTTGVILTQDTLGIAGKFTIVNTGVDDITLSYNAVSYTIAGNTSATYVADSSNNLYLI